MVDIKNLHIRRYGVNIMILKIKEKETKQIKEDIKKLKDEKKKLKEKIVELNNRKNEFSDDAHYWEPEI